MYAGHVCLPSGSFAVASVGATSLEPPQPIVLLFFFLKFLRKDCGVGGRVVLTLELSFRMARVETAIMLVVVQVKTEKLPLNV